MSNTNQTFTKKVENEIKNIKNASWSIKIFIFIFTIGFIFVSFNETFRIPNLKDKINSLKEDISTKNSQIQLLETKLVPFKIFALKEYTGSEQEALTKLANNLNKLENELKKMGQQNIYKPLSEHIRSQVIENLKNIKNNIKLV